MPKIAISPLAQAMFETWLRLEHEGIERKFVILREDHSIQYVYCDKKSGLEVPEPDWLKQGGQIVVTWDNDPNAKIFDLTKRTKRRRATATDPLAPQRPR